MKFTCSCCGKEHEEWPAIAYSVPSLYFDLSEEELKDAELTSDLCIIRSAEQTDFFIRGFLIQKVTDDCQTLDYGIWVSLSDKNYKEYLANYENEDFVTKYFGWFSNHLPGYTDESTESIPTTVVVDNRKGRPEIIPHETYNHKFVFDYYNGITKAEAEKRLNAILKK